MDDFITAYKKNSDIIFDTNAYRYINLNKIQNIAALTELIIYKLQIEETRTCLNTNTVDTIYAINYESIQLTVIAKNPPILCDSDKEIYLKFSMTLMDQIKKKFIDLVNKASEEFRKSKLTKSRIRVDFSEIDIMFVEFFMLEAYDGFFKFYSHCSTDNKYVLDKYHKFHNFRIDRRKCGWANGDHTLVIDDYEKTCSDTSTKKMICKLVNGVRIKYIA